MLVVLLVSPALADPGHGSIPLGEPQTPPAPSMDEHMGDTADEMPHMDQHMSTGQPDETADGRGEAKSEPKAEKPDKAPTKPKTGSTMKTPMKKHGVSESEAAGRYQLNTTAANNYFIALGITLTIIVLFVVAVVKL